MSKRLNKRSGLVGLRVIGSSSCGCRGPRARSARHTWRLQAVAWALLASQGPAHALDHVWLGGSGTWGDASRWSLLGVPGAGDTATLQGGSHAVQLTADTSVGGLFITNGTLGGTAVLTTGAASFGSATLGWNTAAAEGTLNVNGPASFAGGSISTLRYGQIVNLNGNTTWSAGNGRIEVGNSYAGSSSDDPYRASQLNIAAGSTFTDAGAAAAAGSKTIGYHGGQIHNAGTYVRNGVGTTVASYGFNNTGTVQVNSGTFMLDGNSSLRSQSSGQINVASGAVLNLGHADITGGRIANAGRVLLNSNGVATVAADASIGGAWELNHSSAQLKLTGTHSINSLTLTSGYLGGTAVLNTGAASFGSATLGWNTAAAEGTLNVNGPASFAGGSISTLRYGQIVNLNGNTTWSAGNGRIEVGNSYAGSSSDDPYRASQLNIAAGSTFTDAGAAAAAGSKTIGYHGGQIHNAGTYVRNGLGTTVASDGFHNTGTVQINAGVFAADDRFVNSGEVMIATGASLRALDPTLRNAGLISGTGTVKTYGAAYALTNNGTLAPGSAAAPIGTLTIDGDLSNADTAVFRVDLGAGGTADRLVITDDVLWNGELALHATPGLALNVGDSFVLATFDQRLSASVFDSITWHGAGGAQFALDYNAHDLTLRVTAAVPEPATYALWLLGLAGLLAWRGRRLQRGQNGWR